MVINIPSTLRDDLLNLLLEEVSLAKDAAGRDTLLEGIPNHKNWTRERDRNHRVDLDQIYNSLKSLFIKEETFEEWGLIIFIDNVCETVKGTTTEKKLKELKRKFKEYSPQYTQSVQMFQSNCSDEPLKPQDIKPSFNQARNVSWESPPLGKPPPEIRKPQNQPSTEGSPPENPLPKLKIPVAIAGYVQKAMDEINVVCQLFLQTPLEFPDSVGCRNAILHLNIAMSQLYVLRTSIERGDIAVSDSHLFKDHASHLVEQIIIVQDRIDTSHGVHPDIPGSLITIQQKFSHFETIHAKKRSDQSDGVS